MRSAAIRPPTVRPCTVRPRTVRPRTVRPPTVTPRTVRPPTVQSANLGETPERIGELLRLESAYLGGCFGCDPGEERGR
jgi:hypothetical protein